MPTYDYRCQQCGSVTEALVKIADRDNPQACPECAGKATRALITPPRIDWLGLGYTSDSPEFIDRMVKRGAEQKDKEERSMRDHGDYGPRPGA